MTNKPEKKGKNQPAPSIPDIQLEEDRIIGLGIDLVECARVVRMLDVHSERFLGRCFTRDEADYCMARPDPVPDLAVRLAAKEACFKAIGGRRGMGLEWREFEVILDGEGIPVIRLHGKARNRGKKIGLGKTWLSLTHEDLWVAAVVIMVGRMKQADVLSD